MSENTAETKTAEVNITELIRDAVKARKDSLESLRDRISELLSPLPVGTVIKLDLAGEETLKVIRICQGCSQWGGDGRDWDWQINGKGYLHCPAKGTADDLKLLAVTISSQRHNGSNMFFATGTGYYELRRSGDGVLEPATDEGALDFLNSYQTRELAKRLPAAIQRYMQECAEEEKLNNATLAETE